MRSPPVTSWPKNNVLKLIKNSIIAGGRCQEKTMHPYGSGAVLFLTVMALNAYAHPPSDIQITFNSQTKILQAVMRHNVKDSTKHFIEKVDVGLNGEEIISHMISRQDNNQEQTIEYLIPDAKAGDILSVEGYCNLGGKLEKEVQVQ